MVRGRLGWRASGQPIHLRLGAFASSTNRTGEFNTKVTREVIECTPEEYLQLKAASSLSRQGRLNAHGRLYELELWDGHARRTLQVRVFVLNPDLIGQNPAKTELVLQKNKSIDGYRIMLAFVKHSGSLRNVGFAFRDWTLMPVVSLRKTPVRESLTLGWREASSNRIEEFYSVRQNSNGDEESDRVYVVSQEVLHFIEGSRGSHKGCLPIPLT